MAFTPNHTHVIEYLKSFNRKERFHLVGQLLGNPEFRLDPNILAKILRTINLDVPSNYFAAMDYHLDWIYASLYLTVNPDKRNTAIYRGKADDLQANEASQSCDTLQISGTQQDVDFIIAFLDDEDVVHIVMIEAKGDTGFDKSQLSSKRDRIDKIFLNPNWSNFVKPHFVYFSNSKMSSSSKPLQDLPDYMKNSNGDFNCLHLYMPANQRKVTRCDKNLKSSDKGTHWKVDHFRSLPSN
ncbi:hypothetical protein MJH12_05500 [bacterium]|nr:hypothetical protein [bacterium]